jgi:hypothetical protein
MRYTQGETQRWRRGLKDSGVAAKTPPPVNDLETDEIMAAALYWLEHSETQHRVTGREIGFVASIHLQYRQGNKISSKQKRYVVALLAKHSK